MPNRKIPHIEIYDNGFYIRYNGIGIKAIRSSSKKTRKKNKYTIQLYRIMYGLGDVIESERTLGDKFRAKNMKQPETRTAIAEKVRTVTQTLCSSDRFGDDDESTVYRLLTKYAAPEQLKPDPNQAFYPNPGSRRAYEEQEIEMIRQMFRNKNRTTLEEKISE